VIARIAAFLLFCCVPPAFADQDLAYPWDLRWENRVNVAYGPDASEKADLLIPRMGVHPAIIFIHGGGWKAGDKSAYVPYAELYAKAGFAVVNLNYRLVNEGDPSTQWPAQFQDVQLALRWVRANAADFHIDPAKICLLGDSAGAHLAMMLAYKHQTLPGDRSDLIPDQAWDKLPRVPVVCVVSLFGIADLTSQRFITTIFGPSPLLFGGRSPADAPKLYHDASPIFLLESISPPTFVVQGLRDQLVTPDLGDELDKALSKARVEHVYRKIDAAHDFLKTDPEIQYATDEAALEWVLEHILP
jgi:acetyl esterase/lipase